MRIAQMILHKIDSPASYDSKKKYFRPTSPGFPNLAKDKDLPFFLPEEKTS
jgi:hypothetical protein